MNILPDVQIQMMYQGIKKILPSSILEDLQLEKSIRLIKKLDYIEKIELSLLVKDLHAALVASQKPQLI